VRKIAAAQGSSSAFVFRASPGRKQLIRVAVIAFVVATVGNIAIGRSQTASNASQLIRWVLYDAALFLIVWGGLHTKDLLLTQRGMESLPVGMASGSIVWGSIESVRLVRRPLGGSSLDVRLPDGLGFESSRAWTRKAVAGRG